VRANRIISLLIAALIGYRNGPLHEPCNNGVMSTCVSGIVHVGVMGGTNVWKADGILGTNCNLDKTGGLIYRMGHKLGTEHWMGAVQN
jgi:hypothetical protein